jgi:hypothetical protein
MIKGQTGFDPVPHSRFLMVDDHFTAYGLDFSDRQPPAPLKYILYNGIRGQLIL